MSSPLALNPTLPVQAYANAYAQHGVVRIAHVMTPDAAETVAQILEEQIPWKLDLSEKKSFARK